jgi:hypothetical protein
MTKLNMAKLEINLAKLTTNKINMAKLTNEWKIYAKINYAKTNYD